MNNNDTAPQPPMTPRERQYQIDCLTYDYAQSWRRFVNSWLDPIPMEAPDLDEWIARWPQYADELRAFDKGFRAGRYTGFERWDTPSDANEPLSATAERVMARIRAQRRGEE